MLRFGMSGGELIGRGTVAPGRTAALLGGSTPFYIRRSRWARPR